MYGRSAVIGFAEAAIEYMEAGHSKRFLAPLIRHYGHTKIAKIDQAAMNNAARTIYPGAAQSTIRRQVFTPTKAVINYATGNRPQAREKERIRTRWLTLDEVDALILHAGPQAGLLTLMVECGPRTSEALRLEWSDVDMDAGRVFFEQSKQGTARWVEFGPRTRAALASLCRPEVRTGRVFLTPKGKPYSIPKDGNGGNPIKRGFDKAKRAAGILDAEGEIDPTVTPHVLRHTWASWAYAVDPDSYRVGEAGGWADGQMPRRYVKLCPPGYGESVIARGWRPHGERHVLSLAAQERNRIEAALPVPERAKNKSPR